MNDIIWKKSACPYDCPDSCGLLLETDGKTVFSVKGDPDHPITKGFICRKMQHFEKTIHHPDRILTPLKRIGAKGSGQFEPISWDAALTEITDRWKTIINEYGSEAILPYSYAGNLHIIQNKCGEAFFHKLQASRLERTICSKAKTAGFNQILGNTGGINPNDMAWSDFIVVWGCNVNATQLHIQAQIIQAKKRGVKVVLIETYKTPTAALADEVILVPPGTDSALALAIGHVLKKQHLIDKTFLKKYTNGWRRFLSSLDMYTPEWASTITNIPAASIRQLAMEYGNAKAPIIIPGSGFSRHGNGAMTTRCISALPLLKGVFFKRGAGIAENISAGDAFDFDMVRRPDFLEKETRIINMNQIGSALCGDAVDDLGHVIGRLSPLIKSLYVYNSNPVDIAPAQDKIIKGLLREDLFTVVHERFITDTAKYADIILPADTCAEHYAITTPYGNYAVSLTEPAIEPVGQSRSNWDTFCSLAEYMGFDDVFFKQTNKELVTSIVNKANDIRNRWSKDEAQSFLDGNAVLLKKPNNPTVFTDSGKFEFYCPNLEHPLPAYVANYGGQYPLKLVVAPSICTLNSTFTERKELTDRRGRSVLKMNPFDAYQRGIADGNIIEAYNDLAHVQFFAEVTEDVLPGTVIAEGVYSMEESLTELTVNALLSERLTDAGRAATLCDNTIEIRKI